MVPPASGKVGLVALVGLGLALLAVLVVVVGSALGGGGATEERVLLVGDSVAGELAGPLEAAFAESGSDATFSLLPAVSSPTIRADAARILEHEQPDVVVVLIGTWEATAVETDVEGWEERYTTGVLEPFVAQVQEAGAEVVWLGYPVVANEAEAARHAAMNGVYAELAEQHDGVTYVDAGAAVAGPDGTFQDELDLGAGPELVRAGDGTHLCPAGGALVTAAVVDHLVAERGLEADEGWEDGPWRHDPGGFAEPELCPGAFTDAELAATTSTTESPF